MILKLLYPVLSASFILACHYSNTFGYSNVQSFIQMVLNNLTATSKYDLPTNNEKLANVIPTEKHNVHDYGTFDFVIVGGGSAGTLLTNRLTEIENWNVLLLEAGGPENDFSDIPGMDSELTFSDMNWGYKTTSQRTACFGMTDNKCLAPRGKVLGGSSTTNAKMYVRGNKKDYDHWQEIGNTGWSFEDVLPYFIKSENSSISNGDLGYHGKGGLLDVSYAEQTIFTTTYLKAMEEMGYEVLDYNGKKQIGASRLQFNINGNKIASGGRAFIQPFLCRKNLNITLHAFVTKLLIDKKSKTAHGVEFIKDGRIYTVRASKEVLLSAGAINSPQILILSGLGPKKVLDKFEVGTIVDLPAVGQNMQDHANFIGLNIRTDRILFNESIETLLKYYLHDHRPYTAAYSVDSVGFVNVNDEKSSVPNIQHILIVPPGVAQNGTKIFNFNRPVTQAYQRNSYPFRDITIMLVLLRPQSKGSVTLKSKNPIDFPDINYNYFSDPKEEDIHTIYKAILGVLRILETQAFKSINAKYVNYVSGAICTQFLEFSKEHWYCLIRHLTTTLFHPVGTTRMGKSISDSVVSPKLTVHGTKRLRIIDAGVIPEIPSGNTNAPTYMIAEKAADIIKSYYNVL